MASRFQLLAGQPLYRGSARTRTAIAKEYARALIGLGVVYGLGQLAGATIEEDPRSSDFGKLRFGDTRVDPLMGLSQATVLEAKVISGKRKTAAGRIYPIRGKVPFGQQDTSDVVKQFLRSKLSPVVGGALDIATGKNVVGEKVTPSTVVSRLAVPLAFNDILDVMEENGIARGTAIQILSLFGMGVQNYEATRRPR